MPGRSVPSHVLELRCLACGAILPADYTAATCPSPAHGAERGILDVRYDYDRARRDFPTGAAARAGAPLWRWHSLLPVAAPERPLLTVGDTPLVAAPRLARRLGLAELWLKDDTRNPTRSYKDRATAVGMAIALARGYPGVACASAGNAAISLAGFAAHAGVPCEVFVPSYASPERLRWLHRFGATVHVSTGNYDRAFDECEAAVAAHGWYNRNCAYNPFLVEGKKTSAFEIAAQLDFRLPDAVICASGDGCTLGAIGKGFRELRAMGLAATTPAMVGVQAAAMSPLVARQRGEPFTPGATRTAAASINVERPRNAVRLLAEVRESRGTLLAVDEAQIAAAQAAYAAEAGVVVEAATATTLAGLEALVADGQLRGARVVAVLTGNRD